VIGCVLLTKSSSNFLVLEVGVMGVAAGLGVEEGAFPEMGR